MTEDSLLKELVTAARSKAKEEHERLDERWDRLAAGTLSDEEEAALRALAARSEEDQEKYEAFAPLGAEFRRRVVRSLRSETSPDANATDPASDPVKVAPKRVLAFPSWRGFALGGALAASLAALVFVLVDPGGNGGPGPLVDPGGNGGPGPLPLYAVELAGGDRPMRGQGRFEARQGPVFSRGSRFELVLRPARAVSGEVDVRFFLGRGQEPEPWQPAVRVSADGSVRIQGTVGREIDLPPGAVTLWVVVGRRGKLPDRAQLSPYLDAAPVQRTDWVLLQAAFTVRDEGV